MFTDWHYYQHKVLAYIDGQKVNIPFNLNTLHKLFPNEIANRLENKLITLFGFDNQVNILDLKNTEDKELQFLAKYIYEKIFLNYSKKQWGKNLEEIDKSVAERVPVRISKDDRYFRDKYQGLPIQGYTRVFNKMIQNNKIKILLNTDSNEVLRFDKKNNKIYFLNKPYNGTVIYTGMLDELFNIIFGSLSYRTLRYIFKTYYNEYFQETGTINYPNDYSFTRITEYKHLTGQLHPYTTIAIEYPEEYNDNDTSSFKIPYYPILDEKNKELHQKYIEFASRFKNLIILGRLAEYKYSNMDQIILKALNTFKEKILQ